MTRREQMCSEIDKRKYRADCPFDYEDGFKRGVEWADRHPKREMVNKQEFIEKGKKWILDNFVSKGYGDRLYYRSGLYEPENIANDFCRAMEE